MAAVLQPLQGLSLDQGIMPPSPISQNSSRHGRSKHGGSVVKGNKTRGRGYSVVEDREAMISKALSWVLKRTVEEGEEKEGEDKLVADSEGWADCEAVLNRPNVSILEVTLSELQDLIASPKSRFTLKQKPESDPDKESSFLIRQNQTTNAQRPISPQSATSALTSLTEESENLPDLIVYETSYANYPLILASGGIKRAGGQAHLQFASIKVLEDGTESRSGSDADVSIYIDLRAAMKANGKIEWMRNENGMVITEGDATGVVEKQYWKKAVARRADIGVLFENGEIRKEIPIGLRGKGVKGKRGGGKGKGRGFKEMKVRSEDDESTSD
ncbi:hypothetical protein B7494_g694 [Chlorociboria aeruginascens]|nr:hypothetical protein B7494_g694 [Chlorociboria aeruginascens]